MENLYNSDLFCKRCYIHPMKINVQGVKRKGGRGIPEQVVQLEVKSMKDQREIRGEAIKISVLQGDDDCPDLVTSIIYDTKPVHFLSMVCNDLQWVTKTRYVYNVDSGEVENIHVL